jgi:hypothetical protein
MGETYKYDGDSEFPGPRGGLAGYYMRFIKGFSTIASTLTKLTRKEVKFIWSKECEESF